MTVLTCSKVPTNRLSHHPYSISTASSVPGRLKDLEKLLSPLNTRLPLPLSRNRNTRKAGMWRYPKIVDISKGMSYLAQIVKRWRYGMPTCRKGKVVGYQSHPPPPMGAAHEAGKLILNSLNFLDTSNKFNISATLSHPLVNPW